MDCSNWDTSVKCSYVLCSSRVTRERKERQRLWAQRKTPRPPKGNERAEEVTDSGQHKDEEPHEAAAVKHGMLPTDIVNLLAAREKQVFLSDSEDDKNEEKPAPRKKKQKHYGPEAVILNEIPHAPCLQTSLDFLKKKKMQVSRSHSVLENSNQALRLISSCGLLRKK
ncbi:hypothetical protein IFM89_011922 [Coptis chinensis]|uniref:Uncharacterized protein n=1 Tax=Coptis chinensis TaxID=261450 RepID=A0A835I1L5_9MAGN|nr:hypothetical protein IFM89_011922 [Coptis chinensis]